MNAWTIAGAALAATLVMAAGAEGACSKKQTLTLTLESNGAGEEIGLGCNLQPLKAGDTKDLCAQSTKTTKQHDFTFVIINNCTPQHGGEQVEVQAFLVLEKGALGFESKACGDGSFKVSLPLGPIKKKAMQKCRTRAYEHVEPLPGEEPLLRKGEYHIYFTRVTERKGGKLHKDYELTTPLEFDPQIAVERAGDETLPPLIPRRKRP